MVLANLQPATSKSSQNTNSILHKSDFLFLPLECSLCTQCKQMEMCNSAVLSLNDRAISKYDDDLHYFVLDCKKTTKYYAQNTAQICTICNVLALNKKQQRMMCENKENKSFLFTKIIPNSIQSNVSKMLPKSLIECCLRRVSRLQYGSGFHFCQPKIRTKSIRWSKQLKFEIKRANFANKIAQLLAIKHANCNHLGIYHIITTRFAPPNKNCGLVSEKNANCCHGRKIEDCKA